MVKKPSVNAILKDASNARTVWEFHPDLKIGDITLDDFIAAHDATDASQKEYGKKRVELNGFKNRRDDNAVKLSDFTSRFRFMVRSVYGSDSAQYGQIGGVRTRDRKTPKSRATTAPA
jgi:hypothetical protein